MGYICGHMEESDTAKAKMFCQCKQTPKAESMFRVTAIVLAVISDQNALIWSFSYFLRIMKEQ